MQHPNLKITIKWFNNHIEEKRVWFWRRLKFYFFYSGTEMKFLDCEFNMWHIYNQALR
jgi:hypothetical protein